MLFIEIMLLIEILQVTWYGKWHGIGMSGVWYGFSIPWYHGIGMELIYHPGMGTLNQGIDVPHRYPKMGDWSAQIDRRSLPMINLGMVNNPKPYSLTTTIINNAHPAHYHHQRPLPPHIVTSRPQWPLHASTQQEQDENATPTQECCHDATSSIEWVPTRCHVAHSDVATRRRTRLLFIVVYIQLSHPPSTILSDMRTRGQSRPQLPLNDTHNPQHELKWHPQPPNKLKRHPQPPTQFQASCHISHSDVATRRRTMTSVVVHRHRLFNEHDQQRSFHLWARILTPLPHYPSNNTHSRCHVAVSDLATKRQGEQ